MHDVGARSLDELVRGLVDLVKRCRAGSLRSSEMADPTITVANLGDQTIFGVIYPPQVALVGFGRIVERPWDSMDWLNGIVGLRERFGIDIPEPDCARFASLDAICDYILARG